MNQDKALLVYSGWLGDLVWILPLIRTLKKRFQSLSLVASETQAPLATLLTNSLIDEVFIDTRANRFATARAVRHAAVTRDIGTYIDIKGRGKSGLYIPWSRAARIYAPSRTDAREYALAKLVHPLSTAMPDRSNSGHMVDSYLDIARFFGINDTELCFDITFPEPALTNAESIITRNGLRDRNAIALNLGSAQLSKIWPAARFRELAELLTELPNCVPVIMGARHYPANNNYDLAAARSHFSDNRFLNLVETTDFATDSCLLRSGVFKVAVGNDSFPGHIAGSANEVATGTSGAVRADSGRYFKANRTITLFGPTNPRFCRPYDPTGSFNTAVMPAQYPHDCAYDRTAHVCAHYTDGYCASRNHCMTAITAQQVAAAVETLLRTGSPTTDRKKDTA